MDQPSVIANLFDRIEDQVERSKLELLIKQNPANFIAANIASPPLIALILLFGHTPYTQVFGWTFFGLLLGAARALHHHELTQFRHLGKSPRQWEFELVLLSLLNGFFWAAACILFVHPEDPGVSVVIVAAVFAHISASVAGLATHPKILNAFIFALWVPACTYFIVMQSLFYLQMAILGTFFVVVNISYAVNQGRAVIDSLRLRYENQQLLDELRQQKLIAEEANRAKSRFLAAASHDLRQPLHAMGLFADSLAQRTNSAEASLILDQLRGSMGSLKSLFNSLLDISRLDAGVIKPELNQFNLGKLLRQLAEEYCPQADAKNIQLRQHIGDCWTFSDPVLVEQVLRNLIWNAIKYTDSGGVLIATRRRAQQVIVEVWDTGMGISPTEQVRIFDEFHQINNPERDRSQGIGLGLSIVRRTTKLLNLELGLKSVHGRGSKFSVAFTRLPSPPQTQTDPVEYQNLDINLRGVSVLVVDDDKDIRSSLSLRLRDWGCQVAAAERISEIRQLLDDFSPDILLTDYQLADGETGDMVITEVRDTLGFDVPAIIVTGTTMAEAADIARARDVAILYKPVETKQLWEQMIQSLNQ